MKAKLALNRCNQRDNLLCFGFEIYSCYFDLLKKKYLTDLIQFKNTCITDVTKVHVNNLSFCNRFDQYGINKHRPFIGTSIASMPKARFLAKRL